MRKLTLAATIVVLTSSQMAAAQTGLGPLSILVEELPPEAATCGISQAGITSALRAAMRYNRVEEDRSGSLAATDIYVNVNTLMAGTLCVSSVNLSIRKHGIDSPPGLGPHLVRNVFCDDGTLLTGGNHGPRVSEVIKNVFERCLSSLADRALN
jgi:hypothetical protein